MADISGATTTGTGVGTSTNLIGAPAGTNPGGILGKDDFLKLLLVQLQYQDPTAPTDSGTILTQTSQLAALESSDNTNNTLEKLSAALLSSSQFSTVAAIGKIADIGSNGITFEEGKNSNFEIYFPQDIASGNVEIKDTDGNIVRTIPIATNDKGVYAFDWNGINDAGAAAKSGVYYIEASYSNQAGDSLTTRAGAYPIESVKFVDGQSLLKLGSSYVPFESISEIYEG
ncbi:flagellar hook capping protein [Sulfurimonas sp. MAG313]|nr:FlgD immunoglobulin-like domain containing protein [Sulfurimonas sp. MAG313]MDF1880950.1 flagellar hook capping protein [Sulfurimonas sp. MAG313]